MWILSVNTHQMPLSSPSSWPRYSPMQQTLLDARCRKSLFFAKVNHSLRYPITGPLLHAAWIEPCSCNDAPVADVNAYGFSGGSLLADRGIAPFQQRLNMFTCQGKVFLPEYLSGTGAVTSRAF